LGYLSVSTQGRRHKIMIFVLAARTSYSLARLLQALRSLPWQVSVAVGFVKDALYWIASTKH